MAYIVKEYNQVVEAKRALREMWIAACAFDNITDTSSTFIIFSNDNPRALEYNVAMGRYMDLVKRIKKNAAARARHKAHTDLRLKRVKGALGGVYYE